MYYKDLEVWKEAIKLVKEIYLLTEKFPSEELYGLTAQIRRAAVSVPSNIAEGLSRFSDTEKSRFIDIALGSVAEVDTQLVIAKELGYISNTDVLTGILEKVKALTIGVKKFLNNSQK